MISHTVYRERSNSIVLQLLSDGAALEDASAIDTVELALRGREEWIDTESEYLAYDDEDGTLTMALGRVSEFIALVDGVYEVEVTGFGAADTNGTAFGSFLIYLRDWGGEVSDGS